MAAASGMGRVLGLGFLVGAVDRGATAVARGVATAFTAAKDAVIGLGQQSNALQRFGNAINTLNFMQLSRVSEALEGISDRVGGLQRAGSTSLESFGVQAGQAFRQATAGLGRYREQVEQYRGAITSAGFNLGVDVGQMTQAVTQLVRSGHSLEDYGLTVREIAGSEQAGILTAEQLAQTLTALSEGYEMGAEGARGLLDNVTALGQEFGFGADAARAIPNILQAADPILSEFSDLNVDDVTTSITRLSNAMAQGLGVSFEQASQDAIATFQQLGQSRTELRDMMTGLGGGEFNQLARELGIFTGDVDGSIEAIMQNPFEFAQRMREMYQSVSDPMARQRLMGSLRELPANFRFLITGGDEMSAAMQRAGASVDDASGAFGRMSRSSSGAARTFDESMDLIEEGFRTRMNAMARRHYPNFERNVLDRQREGFRALEETINRHTEGNGPLATFGRVALATRRGGVTGLTIALEEELTNRGFGGLARRIRTTLPILGEAGEALFEMAGQAGPALLAFSQMGVRIPRLGGALSLLINPFTLFVGGGIMMVRHWDTIGPMLQNITGRMRDLSRQVLQWVRNIDWRQMGRDIVDGFFRLFDDLNAAIRSDEASETSNALVEFFRNAFSAATEIIGGLAGGIWERISDWMTEPSTVSGVMGRRAAVAGGAIGAAMFTPLRGPMLAAGRGALGFVFRGLGAALQGGGMLAAGRLVLRRIPVIGALLGVLFDLPEIIGAYETGGIGQALSRTFASIIDGVLLGLPSLIFGDAATDLFQFIFEATNIPRLVQAISDGNIGEAIFEGVFTAFNYATFGIAGALRTALGDSGIEEEIDRVGGTIMDEMNPVFDDMGRGWDHAMQGLEDSWNMYGVPIKDEMMGFGEDTMEMFNEVITEVIGPLIQELSSMFIEDISGTGTSSFEDVGRSAADNFRQAGQSASNAWNGFIKPAFIGMLRGAAAFTSFMRRNVIEVWARVNHIATDATMNVVGGFRLMRVHANSFRDVVSAGFRLIGIRIRNFFVLPFREARGSIRTLRENFEIMMQIIDLKMTQIGRSVMETINRLAGYVGAEVFSPQQMQQAAMAVQLSERNLQRMRDEQRRRQARDQEEINNMRLEGANAELQLQQEQLRVQQESRRVIQQTESERQRAHQRIDRVGQMFTRAEERLEGVIQRLTSGEITQERLQQVREASTRMARGLQEQVENEVLTQDQAQQFLTQLEQAAASGRRSRVAEVQRDIDQAVQRSETEREREAERRAARRSRRRRRGGVTPRTAEEPAEAAPVETMPEGDVIGPPAEQGAEPSPADRARDASEQAAEAQRERQTEEQQIGGFSDQAVGQLATAFAQALRRAGVGGGAAGRGGRRGRPAGGADAF